MANVKDKSFHVEIEASASSGGATAEEIELQQALSNYIPETDAEKKLRRKIDLHLMPILWIMYILNYVDRTNIVRTHHASPLKPY
jgi:hypothetical protein